MAVFLISPLEPCWRMDFIGKDFYCCLGKVWNRCGLMVDIVALYLKMHIQHFSHKNMAGLLGKLEWILRPNASLGLFLPGSR